MKPIEPCHLKVEDANVERMPAGLWNPCENADPPREPGTLEPGPVSQSSAHDYRLLVEHSPDAILVECDGVVVFANPAALRLFHAQQPADLLGRSLESLAAPDQQASVAASIDSVRRGGPCSRTEEQALRMDGAVIDVAVTRLSFSYHGMPAIHMMARDISEPKQLVTQLHHQATHDPLTGLPNRALLVDRLHRAIVDAKRRNSQFVVAFIDLDRFKSINDRFGHEAGDKLLQIVGQRISHCLRESDTVARIGGDEFVLLLRESGNVEESMQVLDRVLKSVSQEMALGGQPIAVTCSMGCCIYPEDGEDPEALLRFSDAAMYRAKETGRNNMQRYGSELRSRLDEEFRLATELRHAIGRDELRLHYQLQIELQTGCITGLEALLRWRHPILGNIEPAKFIPIAESAGLIEWIDEWALREACLQNKAWQREGLMPVRVCVKLSAKELERPSLEQRVADALAISGLDPRHLELELSESAFMSDPEKILPLLSNLKALGVRLSIDDFGIGYSNLRFLQHLPVERLKLHGSYTREIETSPGCCAIAEAIVSAAHGLGMKVVAELVETEKQVAMLAACGCDEAQGYYFSPPLPPDRCADLLRSGSLAAGLGQTTSAGLP